MRILSLILLNFLSLSWAMAEGKGRDGGHPESILLLRHAKQILIELVKESSTKEVQQAMNNMVGRMEYYTPQNITQQQLLTFLTAIKERDVLELKKDIYQGPLFFDYDDSNSLSPSIWATMRYYNLERYQVPVQDASIILIKEIQKRLLHEVSHLWGYGEIEASAFAKNMIDLLYQEGKADYSWLEMFKLMPNIFYYSTYNYHDQKRMQASLQDRYECRQIGSNQSHLQVATITKAMNSPKLSLDGHSDYIANYHYANVAGPYYLRFAADDYVIIEEQAAAFSSPSEVYSVLSYYEFQNAKKSVRAYYLCHPHAQMLDKTILIEKFFNHIYVKKSLFRSRYLPLNIFIDETYQLAKNYLQIMNQVIESLISVQEKQRSNYAMITSSSDYTYLINIKKRKYTADEDRPYMEKVNQMITLGMTPYVNHSTSMEAKHRKETDRIVAIANTINSAERRDFFISLFGMPQGYNMPSHALSMNDQLEKLKKEYNHFDNHQNGSDFMQNWKEEVKSIGGFYKMQIQREIYKIENRLSRLREMQTILMRFEPLIIEELKHYQDPPLSVLDGSEDNN